MSIAHTFSCALFFACLGASAVSAQAAEPAKEGSFGKAKAGALLLTRAELRDCMVRQERVRTHTSDAVTAQAELDKEKAEVARLGAALKEQLATLDRTSPEAVTGYNEQVQAFDKRVDAYNAGTPAFNAKVEAMKTEREAFAKGCENRRFDEKDETAIKSGK